MSTEARRAADHRYNVSPAGRARYRRYNRSPKGRVRSERYRAEHLSEVQARDCERWRRKAGWYEPGGMATDEEMRQFLESWQPPTGPNDENTT